MSHFSATGTTAYNGARSIRLLKLLTQVTHGLQTNPPLNLKRAATKIPSGSHTKFAWQVLHQKDKTLGE